ncbi:MAG: restriction endonuclease subunit S [Patescibacteria group bacterium]
MKTNWQTKKLGEICEVFDDGDWIEKKDQSLNGIRLIQTGNVGNGIFKDRIEKARYISEKTFKRLQCTEIIPGDCLVSRLPDPVGRSCIIPDKDDKMITAVDCTIIRFKKRVILPELFIKFSLSQEYQAQINKEVGGATRQRISRKKLDQIEIPLPPISEQKRIIKILDSIFEKIDKAIKNTNKNLNKSKELFESYLNYTLNNPEKDWVEEKLKDIGQTQTGSTPKTSNNDLYGNFIPFIKPADINIKGEGSIRYDNEGLSKKGLMAGRKIDKNSILMVCIGATIGKVGFSNKPVCCNQQINTLTPKSKCKQKIFYYILSTKSFINKVILESSQATLPIINKSKWENLSVIFPKSPAKQKLIVSKIEELSSKTNEIEMIYKQKLVDLEELKKSILKRAFNGKI